MRGDHEPRRIELSPARQDALRKKPVERVVITGIASITALGDAEQTFERLNKGESGVVVFDVGHHDVRIAAPLPEDYQPLEQLSRKERLGQTVVGAMSIAVARQAFGQAGLLEEGRLKQGIDPDRVAGWIGSGVAGTPHFIDLHTKITEHGSSKIGPRDALQIFPEQVNGRTSIDVGYSGWGGNTIEACATGASNIIEGVRLIQGGDADIVLAGGFDEVLRYRPDVAIGLFGGLRALSKRNDDPQAASRPYDRDRDGFVHGAGGGLVVVESEQHARERGAKIYAEIDGTAKSMDGKGITDLDRRRVAKTVEQALFDRKTGTLKVPDAIFAHATSTHVGDLAEGQVFIDVFGREMENVKVTAIKSMIGHLLGGAGSANVVEAVMALNAGVIPPIKNLENPDERLSQLENSYVTGSQLEKPLGLVAATAFGFGGHNAVIGIKQYYP